MTDFERISKMLEKYPTVRIMEHYLGCSFSCIAVDRTTNGTTYWFDENGKLEQIEEFDY